MSVLQELDQIRAYLASPGQPFEMLDRDIGGRTVRVYKNAPPNITHLIAQATAYGDRVFLVDGSERLTFKTVLDRAAGLAGVLRADYGVARGARVAIAMRNSPDWVVAFLAILLAGAVPVLINSRVGDLNGRPLPIAQNAVFAHQQRTSVTRRQRLTALVVGKQQGAIGIV